MKKKILHIISSIVWRGCEQQVHYLFNHQSNDFEYYLFCPKNAELEKRNAVKKDKIFTYKKRVGFDLFAAIELKKVCKKHAIDIIQLHDSHAINTYILADLLGMNLPAIIHRHVNHPITSNWKYNHKKIKKIICVSEVVKNTVSKMVDEKKLVVVHPAIDIKKFETETIRKFEKKDFIVGIISALEKEKNIEEFIEIANKISIKRKDIKFIIVGDGSLKFHPDINQNKQHNTQISFLGFRNDIPEILSTLDVFLFTSKSEGLGIVLLEAMAAKVPIVSNNFPAVREVIENEQTGYIYTTIEDAIHKIEILITKYEIQNTIIENAFNFVQDFDITLMNKKIEVIYNNLFTND